MIVSHLNKTPQIDPSAYEAPDATICGDVIIGPGCYIMFVACVVAEGAINRARHELYCHGKRHHPQHRAQESDSSHLDLHV